MLNTRRALRQLVPLDDGEGIARPARKNKSCLTRAGAPDQLPAVSQNETFFQIWDTSGGPEPRKCPEEGRPGSEEVDPLSETVDPLPEPSALCPEMRHSASEEGAPLPEMIVPATGWAISEAGEGSSAGGRGAGRPGVGCSGRVQAISGGAPVQGGPGSGTRNEGVPSAERGWACRSATSTTCKG